MVSRDEDDGEEKKMQKLTLAELAAHNSADDCWLLIHGKIYDVTKYLDEHPGGEQVLLQAAGEDATEEFEDIGHSAEAWGLMEQYLVGEVDLSPSPDKRSDLVYKTLPLLASLVVLGLIAAAYLWRSDRVPERTSEAQITDSLQVEQTE